MSLKDEYFAVMTSQLRRWDARFGMLTEDAGPTITAADARCDAQIKAMRANRDVAYRRLQEIRTASESTWRGMQSGVDEAWISLKNALERSVRESGKRRRRAPRAPVSRAGVFRQSVLTAARARGK